METNYTKIVLAYNGSQNCLGAFKKASELAKSHNIPLEVITVTEFINTVALDLSATGIGTYAPIYVEDEYDPNQIIEQKKQDIINQANKLTATLSKVEILFGEPAQEIINYIEADENSLLVISSSEKKNYEKWILGSVARTLSEKAPIDTLIIRKHEGN